MGLFVLHLYWNVLDWPVIDGPLLDLRSFVMIGQAEWVMFDLLGVAIPEHLEVDDTRWASLVAPVAPVDLQLAKTVGEWRAGDVSLAADDVGPFLRAPAAGESEAERIDRQADFWTAWLPLVRSARATCRPSMSGSRMSSSTRSTVACSTNCRACCPVRTRPTTWNPSTRLT